MILINALWILAQSPASQPAGGPDNTFLYIIAIGGVLLFLMMTKSSKKQRRDRETLLKNLKRGDRIQTIGGMLATVVDVDKDEVLLKIDETTNTKAKFLRSAIHTVITEKNTSDQAK